MDSIRDPFERVRAVMAGRRDGSPRDDSETPETESCRSYGPRRAGLAGGRVTERGRGKSSSSSESSATNRSILRFGLALNFGIRKHLLGLVWEGLEPSAWIWIKVGGRALRAIVASANYGCTGTRRDASKSVRLKRLYIWRGL